MINHDDYPHARHHRGYLAGKLTNESSIVVDGDIRNDINREYPIGLGVVEAMHLDYLLMDGECLHHL